ncbi:MAG TPA: hypothetical protein VFB37_13265 [Steroidobacteraceae bacterium]|nr:hypothetical protein [Steroidobacteraceae bacterium]
MAANLPTPMRAGLRMAIYIVFGALWVSGCLWLLLHEFFTHPGDFGPLPNPWEPAVLRLHGWIAVTAVFLLGWITARHVSDRWGQTIKRPSGLAVVGVAVVLVLSGYALYYTTDGLHDIAAAAHEMLGAAGLLFALLHWRRYRPRTAARKLAQPPPPESSFPAT